MRPRTRLVKLLLVLIAVFLSVLVPATVSAYTKCAKYGQCTICDFYGPNGEYQGYIEWCF